MNGYKVTGPSGNFIFLPAAGYYNDDANKYVLNWTGSDDSFSVETANCLYGNSSNHNCNSRSKYFGLTIRPVTTNPNDTGKQTDHSQDYLVTDKISARFTGGAYSMINSTIQSGSQSNWQFVNSSSESVLLTGVPLIKGTTEQLEAICSQRA